MTGSHNSKPLSGHSNDEECAPLVSISDVSMGWEGRTVLSHVSMHVCEGDFLAITGPNGGGKSTLLKLILGLLKPMSGKVVRNVRNLTIG